MMKLVDAVTHRFPQKNPWAADALASLDDQLNPATPIHELVAGWYHLGEGHQRPLLDVVFVLTDSRLGIGHPGEARVPRWIELSNITVVDAIDNSDFPLQTIELQQADGSVSLVGWPSTFSDRVIEVLLGLRDRSAPATSPLGDSIPNSLPDPMPEPFLIEGATPPIAPVPAVPVESVPVESVTVQSVPVQSVPVESVPVQPAVAPAPALDFLKAPAPRTAPVDLAPGVANLHGATQPEPRSEAELGADVQPGSAGDLKAGPVTSSMPVIADVDSDAHDIFFGDLDAMAEAASDIPSFDADDRAPWEIMGDAWPEVVVGVNYLGGHPHIKRKRKSGVMAFGPGGMEVKGTGISRWEMELDWNHVNDVEVVGADEIMFSDAIRVPADSSVVVVGMIDGARLFFETVGRRPPTLRSELAPVMSMVSAGRVRRANRPRETGGQTAGSSDVAAEGLALGPTEGSVGADPSTLVGGLGQ